MSSDRIEPLFISLEDAARRVVAIYTTDGEMSDRLVFALGVLAGVIDRDRTGGWESDAD